MRLQSFIYAMLISTLTSCSNNKANPNHLFQKLSKTATGIDFRNDLKEDINHNILNYIYYYNGAGVATGDINNDGLPDLYFVSNQGQNKLYLNKGDLQFEDISETANIASKSNWNTGVTMIDINADGYLDIYLCSVSGILDFKGHNELFINNGNNTFTESSEAYGLDFKGYATQSYFFDYDKDNDLDVYIVNHAVHTTLSHGASKLRNKRVPLIGDVLLKNDQGKFTDVSEEASIFGGVNGYGLSASIADFNNDGWEDIYVANDFHEDDYFYLNNKDGTFRESLSSYFSTISRFSMGSDAADINGDGLQDLIVLDMLPSDERVLKETEGDDVMLNMQNQLRKLGYSDQYARNMLHFNNDGKYFHEAAFLNNVAASDWSWAPLIADYNNDGHQDLFISNGILRRPNGLDFKKYVANSLRMNNAQEGQAWLFNSIDQIPSGDVTNEIFKGDTGSFEKKTGQWIENTPSLSNGALYADLDLDGDLDLVLNNLNSYATIYENTSDNNNNYLAIKLNYIEGNVNGIGSKVLVYADNKRHFKQLFNSRGFLSSVENKLYYGLDSINQIDSIQIIWPDNTFQTVRNISANQEFTVAYVANSKKYNYEVSKDEDTFFKKSNAIEYLHEEDLYNDFHHEKLSPYKVSTLGPAMAIGDIDNNGFDDVFLGNSSGKMPLLYLNDGQTFSQKAIPDMAKDILYEDNDAIFFDADNDNDLDLYVASGISSIKSATFIMDRLYINENGIFKKSDKRIPPNTMNASCVIAHDYDNDGDIDLFIGNLSRANNFGQKVDSYLLKNNGEGFFTKDTSFSLKEMVTSAVWEDIDGDGDKDLLVSVEWGTPKIYKNNNGELVVVETPDTIDGLWQAAKSFDIDQDGDRDILLGNWGLNTKFNPSATKPLRMYYGDFDSNGKKETVLAYNVNGSYYPVHSKDELASQMTSINKKYVLYKDYAMKTIEDIFSKNILEKSEMSEVNTLASGYLKNNNGVYDEFVPFSDDFQLAPITNFDAIQVDNQEQILLSGNSKKVNTYHGAFLSLNGLIMKSVEQYKKVSDYGMEPFTDQIKKTETIKMKDRNVLLVLANNDSLKVYEYKR